MNILDKIKNVEISILDRISQNDIDFCKKQQNEYLKVFLQLDEKKEQFEKEHKLFNESFNINRALKNYNNGTIHIQSAQTENFDSCLFDPVYSLYAINKLIDKLNASFVHEIKYYFISTYSIGKTLENFNFLTDENKSSQLRFEDIINFIFSHIGNVNLNEQGIEEMKQQLKKGFWSGVKMSKNKISFIDYVSFYNTFSRNEIHYSDELMMNLCKALSYFENESLKTLQMFESVIPQRNEEVLFSTNYITSDSEKLESVKFFKNRRLDLNFNSTEQANAFFQMFSLYEHKGRN
jgi:hypothetical protein